MQLIAEGRSAKFELISLETFWLWWWKLLFLDPKVRKFAPLVEKVAGELSLIWRELCRLEPLKVLSLPLSNCRLFVDTKCFLCFVWLYAGIIFPHLIPCMHVLVRKPLSFYSVREQPPFQLLRFSDRLMTLFIDVYTMHGNPLYSWLYAIIFPSPCTHRLDYKGLCSLLTNLSMKQLQCITQCLSLIGKSVIPPFSCFTGPPGSSYLCRLIFARSCRKGEWFAGCVFSSSMHHRLCLVQFRGIYWIFSTELRY